MGKLEVKIVDGKGRGVFAAAPIEAGEVVLTDMPAMLYPQESFRRAVCSFCLKSLALAGPSTVACPSCQQTAFCSPACAAAAAADPGSHPPLVCRCLTTCNLAGLSDEQQTALHLLLRATSLRAAAAGGDADAGKRYAAITSLAGAGVETGAGGPAGPGSEECSMETRELHGRLAHSLAAAGAGEACPSLQEVGDLLRKDGVNSYGIMAPSDPEGERKIRGAGIYPTAALINHECLPNLARFDCFDAQVQAPGANTAIQLRALHAIPQGEELTQAYFPLTWSYRERQQRCEEQYGFTCTCPRCKEEATWPSEDEAGSDEWMTDDEAGGEAQKGAAGACPTCGGAVGVCAACGGAQGDGVTGEPQADAAYISLFLLKYICPFEGCGGTLAPLPGAPRAFECNMCGLRRTEDDFLAELQAAA